MPASYQQQLGTVKFGLTAGTLVNVHDDVIKCRFVKTADSVERGATFGNPRKTVVAGAYKEEIMIDFYSLGTNAQNTLDGLINTVVMGATPSYELFFEFSQQQTATALDNVKITGRVSVLEYAKGGEAQQLRKESITMTVITSTSVTA